VESKPDLWIYSQELRSLDHRGDQELEHSDKFTLLIMDTIHQLMEYVRFEVFTAVTMKNAAFWDVTPYGFITNRRSPRYFFYHEFGGDTFLRNIGL
jgi:hypothetical protein